MSSQPKAPELLIPVPRGPLPILPDESRPTVEIMIDVAAKDRWDIFTRELAKGGVFVDFKKGTKAGAPMDKAKLFQRPA